MPIDAGLIVCEDVDGLSNQLSNGQSRATCCTHCNDVCILLFVPEPRLGQILKFCQ